MRTSLNVLVVDASKTSGFGLVRKLNQINCKVDFVKSPEEGLVLCDSLNIHYDIIFTSLVFSKMTGYEFAREIRNSHENMKIVAYTSINPNQVDMTYFHHYLPKSFGLDVLDEIICDSY